MRPSTRVMIWICFVFVPFLLLSTALNQNFQGFVGWSTTFITAYLYANSEYEKKGGI